MQAFITKHKKRIVIFCVALLLAMPLHVTCGNLFYACATAPDESGNYYTYYEIQPLGITLLEVIVQTNLPIYYTSGQEAHFLGVP